MKIEKEFMLLFRYTPNPNYEMTEEEATAQKESWGSFIGNLVVQEKLVSTYQLGFEGKQLSTDLSVSEGFRIDNNETLGGNMVIRAQSIDEAVTISKNCPILQMGGNVEVRSINPMS